MNWLIKLLKNWSFIAVFISVIFLWYYITFTPNEALDRTFAISLSLGAIIAYITHSTLQATRVEASLEQMSDEISKGFDFRVVTDRNEFLRLLETTIRNAKSRILVTHFDSAPPEKPYRSKERENYWSANDEIIRRNNIEFTRIISVDNQDKMSWLSEQLADYEEFDKYNLLAIHLGTHSPVVMEMLVVDGTTAMFWPSTHDRDETYIWISGREELVGALQRCYDSISARSMVIKDGRSIRTDNINAISKNIQRLL